MDLIGRSVPIVTVRAQVARVAPLDTPVLITGEPGTGKDLVAAAIHKAGPRAGRRMLAFDVASIPESRLESTCFGAAEAQGSSVLLCHLQCWPRALQPALLRRLRERVVRIIATTDADPEELLVDGVFSEALYDALSVGAIHVPPLRDRVDDVPLLARYFLDRMARDYRKDITGFVPAALAILTRHDWPGNVRELMNVVERAVLFSTNKRIVPDDVAGLLQGR